ncbi:MAG: hypothetical protein LBP52_03770 [Burkholderiaceae bacterium]|jgi:hypothetical protein|nr:hypothetical protein [Burkholderiaceae bacterium]
MLLFLKDRTREVSELLGRIMLKGIEQSEEHEDAFKQRGQGDGMGRFHLASGQAHKKILGLLGRIALFAGETPDQKTSMSCNKQALEDGAAAFLFLSQKRSLFAAHSRRL